MPAPRKPDTCRYCPKPMPRAIDYLIRTGKETAPRPAK